MLVGEGKEITHSNILSLFFSMLLNTLGSISRMNSFYCAFLFSLFLLTLLNSRFLLNLNFVFSNSIG